MLAPDVLVLQDKALATPGADFTFILRNRLNYTTGPIVPWFCPRRSPFTQTFISSSASLPEWLASQPKTELSGPYSEANRRSVDASPHFTLVCRLFRDVVAAAVYAIAGLATQGCWHSCH